MSPPLVEHPAISTFPQHPGEPWVPPRPLLWDVAKKSASVPSAPALASAPYYSAFSRARAIKYRQENQEAVGGFFSQIGELYVVHHLWAYKDLQSREETRNAAWRKRGWDENVYYTVPLVRHMESRIMIPLKISPLQ